ncbi:hypothetical protein QBC39DRAFT_364548 [Podospora conica]|nr:hypothetical protein QBC39DRAFT_364548 [Schizothecium conicum]
MVRLPPAEKLPLALRKNVRDEWDSVKEDLTSQLTQVLGEEWTIDITPAAIWPYHDDGYAKESLGSCIKAYVEGAIYQLKYLTEKYDGLAQEINDIAHAHVLTLDVDEADPPPFSYCRTDVNDGQLRMLFVETNLGVNISDTMTEAKLFAGLNQAPNEQPLSFLARFSVKTEYEPKVAEARHSLAELLGKADDEVTLTPNFEDTFAQLAAAKAVKGSSIRDDWETVLGMYTIKYFEGLAYQMKYQKVGEDEMVQEGFNEAVPTAEFQFRIVDKLKFQSYCEVEIEDEKLYVQTEAEKWGYNVDDAAAKLMDLL